MGKWLGEKEGRVVGWKGGRFLVLFQDGGCRVSPRFHLFFSDVNQWNKRADGFKILLCGCRDEQTLFRSTVNC